MNKEEYTNSKLNRHSNSKRKKNKWRAREIDRRNIRANFGICNENHITNY
jgi:hypothetical protein